MKEIKKNKISVNVTMSRDVFEKFVEVTESKGMSRSSYISMAVSNQMNADNFLGDLPRTIQALKNLDQEKKGKEMKEIES
jgi:hypothetical protein